MGNNLGNYDTSGLGYPGARFGHGMVVLTNQSVIMYGGFGYPCSSNNEGKK